MQSGRQLLHISQHKSKLDLNAKEFKLKFLTLKDM